MSKPAATHKKRSKQQQQTISSERESAQAADLVILLKTATYFAKRLK